MAGTPKRRARRERAANDGIPDATSAGDPPAAQNVSRETPPLRAPASARTRARAERPPAWDAGPAVRHSADTLRAAQLEDVAGQLRSGSIVRISRTRPLWAAGWIEDFPLDRSGVPGLLEYLRDEHGGQGYQLSPLSPTGAVLADFPQFIAGAVRLRGRAVDRDAYERGGARAPEQPAAIHAPAAAAANDTSMIKLVLDEARESRNATLDAVREMAKDSRAAVDRILQNREAPARRSLAAELGELEQTSAALRRVSKTLGGGAPTAAPTAQGPQEMRDVLKNEFARGMMRQFMGGGKEPQQQRRPPGNPPQPRPVASQPSPARAPAPPAGDGIPDAL